MRAAVVLVLVLVVVVGCYQPDVPTGVRCSQSGECPVGQDCDLSRGICGGTPIDASVLDVDAPLDAIDAAMIDAPILGAWSAALPISPINTDDSVETDPALSSDGLELFFASDRPGGPGNLDIYRAARLDASLPFAPPTLVVELSTVQSESGLYLTSDHLTLYFHRAGEILRATRPTRLSPFGAPVAEPELSSPDNDINPGLSPDGLTATVTRQLTATNRELYLYTRPSLAASWSIAVRMTELSSALTDSGGELTTDPAELFFHSDRLGSAGTDLYRATRTSPADPFTAPMRIIELSAPGHDSDPTLTADRRLIVFERNENLVYATR